MTCSQVWIDLILARVEQEKVDKQPSELCGDSCFQSNNSRKYPSRRRMFLRDLVPPWHSSPKTMCCSQVGMYSLLFDEGTGRGAPPEEATCEISNPLVSHQCTASAGAGRHQRRYILGLDILHDLAAVPSITDLMDHLMELG